MMPFVPSENVTSVNVYFVTFAAAEAATASASTNAARRSVIERVGPSLVV
jgi:hypothetical protein